jgi:pimeloyl-ACP methyl ester carboxylesterase
VLKHQEHTGIHYAVEGSGHPVILIHGIAASLRDWVDLSAQLVPAGYCAYALDLPGHGESFKPENLEDYHIDRLFHALEGWIQGLQLEEPAVFIGHSLGGYLSLRYACYHPEMVRALILFDPYYSPRQISPVLMRINRRPGLSARVLRRVPEHLIRMALSLDLSSGISRDARLRVVADYKRASPYLSYTAHTLDDLTESLPGITAPTLVLWGEKDLTLKPVSFPNLIARLPNACGEGIAGCRHQPHTCRPGLVNGLVFEFLSGLEKNSSERRG